MSEPVSTPCTACNWTQERQNHCGYKSHVKIIHDAGNRAAWALGSALILKDRGPGSPTYEVRNLQFVRDNTTIPVPVLIDTWEEEEYDIEREERRGNTPRTFLLTRRIPGETLHEAWPKLTAAGRANIARQTAEYLQQLRGLTSPKLEAIGGDPIQCCFLFMQNEEHGQDVEKQEKHSRTSDVLWPQGPLGSDDELWAAMSQGLLMGVPEAARVRLRNRLPAAGPYTFTHGDLSDVNIMVKDGSLTGIIDWERAGFFPVWWEYVGTVIADSPEDREWKTLLRAYMPEYSTAFEWWKDYYFLCRDLESERASKLLEEAGNESR